MRMAKRMPVDSWDFQLLARWPQLAPQKIVPVQRATSFRMKYKIIWLRVSWQQSPQALRTPPQQVE